MLDKMIIWSGFILKKHFITSINIEKLKHIENVKIELSQDVPKHLLLTGKNGAGKTTTLEAVRNYLKQVENDSINTIEYWNRELKQFKLQLVNEKDENNIFLTKNKIDEMKNNLVNYGVYGIKVDMSVSGNELNAYFKHGKFIFAYFSADRRTNVQIPNGVEKINLKESYSMNENPSIIFVKYLVDLKTQQSFARNENDMEVVENIEEWFKRFEKALKFILDDESIELKFDYRNYNFKIYQNGREPYGLNELSSGYSSIINIISDLILRMDKNRAGKERNYTFDTEGIVIIDEIETHLHIELQKKILPFLTDFFPNIQFIVSTHSPFVLNSINNAVIYDLEKQVRVEDLSSYSYDGIVEGYFEIDNYSNELKEKIREYKNLAFRKDLSDDEKARRAELRIELKNASNDLAKELKAEFNEIEEKRKKQQ